MSIFTNLRPGTVPLNPLAVKGAWCVDEWPFDADHVTLRSDIGWIDGDGDVAPPDHRLALYKGQQNILITLANGRVFVTSGQGYDAYLRREGWAP